MRKRFIAATVMGLCLVAGGVRWMTVATDSRREPVSQQTILSEARLGLSGDSEAEREGPAPQTLNQALVEYDSLSHRFHPGALAAERLDWLGESFSSGNLNASDCCKLLDHAMPDLVANPEGGFPLFEQIRVILDLASSEDDESRSDRTHQRAVIDWMGHLKNPRIQEDLLKGAGQWLPRKYQPSEVMKEVERIPTAGGRDRLATAYLENGGLTDSPEPLRDYLNFTGLVGEGRCLGSFYQFPEGTDFSKLPDLFAERKALPSSRILAGLLAAWSVADSGQVVEFVRVGRVGAQADQITSAVARMVEDSSSQAALLAEEFPSSPEKDAWLSGALSRSRRYSHEDALALANQIQDASLRAEIVHNLQPDNSDPFSTNAR